MANKRDLLSKQQIKVETFSGFDKGAYNALTAPLGALTPLRKQLCLPGNGHLRIKVGAQLPPLASDAFLRTHLKVEAFAVPMRILSGSFESWFAQVPIGDWQTSQMYERIADLPRIDVFSSDVTQGDTIDQQTLDNVYGVHSLMDYFGVKKRIRTDGSGSVDSSYIVQGTPAGEAHQYYNAFPFLAYHKIWDDWYRNKIVESPAFLRPSMTSTSFDRAAFIPYIASQNKFEIKYKLNASASGSTHTGATTSSRLGNEHVLKLRYRNYGDDYFTTALPSAQQGSAVTVASVTSFTIASLRQGVSLQRFAEINEIAGPDYVQVNSARYGVSMNAQVAQRPVLLGSADFPMFTSGVEQTATAPSSSNPFTTVGARYGRAHAEGNEFVCDFKITEPSYVMVIASLVPEANYASGVNRDMRIFTETGSIVDLPVASLEGTGFEPIYRDELDGIEQTSPTIFGYQNRYMWHKVGCGLSEVHGLFRRGCSLASFIPQRSITVGTTLSSAFLHVRPTDLDNVMAVSGSLSQYGVMIDSYIDLKVSEPLSESRMPSLVDPAEEHGNSVYIQKGGLRLS